MSDQMRKEFEAWFFAENALTNHWNGKNYDCSLTQGAWMGWQASRASLIVVAPKYDIPEISAKESMEMGPDEYEAQENLAGVIDYVARQYREAITKTGVRVK
jgi:hypothetical protein